MMNAEQIRLAEQYTRETQARQQVVRQYSWYGDPRWVVHQTHCPTCGRLVSVCDADLQGCGTVPAEDEAPPPQTPKEETWRDRPPLL